MVKERSGCEKLDDLHLQAHVLQVFLKSGRWAKGFKSEVFLSSRPLKSLERQGTSQSRETRSYGSDALKFLRKSLGVNIEEIWILKLFAAL